MHDPSEEAIQLKSITLIIHLNCYLRCFDTSMGYESFHSTIAIMLLFDPMISLGYVACQMILTSLLSLSLGEHSSLD